MTGGRRNSEMSLLGLNLFEKLFDDGDDLRGHTSVARLKDSVAKDVEALLNTRCALTGSALQAFPQSQQSVLSFGLRDFVSLSLAKQGDRELICADISKALSLHEPRLKNPIVSVSVTDGPSQHLHFAIEALLVTHETREVVSFDAVLQPRSLHYEVSNGR